MIATLPRPAIWTPAAGPPPPRWPWWTELFACGSQRKSANGGGRRDTSRGCGVRNATANTGKQCCYKPCGACLAGIFPDTITVTISGWTSCGCNAVFSSSAKVISGTPDGVYSVPFVAGDGSGCVWRVAVPGNPVLVKSYSDGACGTVNNTSIENHVTVSLNAGTLQAVYYAGSGTGGSGFYDTWAVARISVSPDGCADVDTFVDGYSCNSIPVSRVGTGATISVDWGI